jgi:hypothetical protein
VDNPRATDDELFSASRTAKNRLAFLTENDWVLITDKSTRVNFTKDDRLIREGQTLKTLYVLIKGTATVSILGKRLAHTQVGRTLLMPLSWRSWQSTLRANAEVC